MRGTRPAAQPARSKRPRRKPWIRWANAGRLDKRGHETYVRGPLFRQDFIKRQIEQFAQALAALAGKRTQGQPEQALVAARQAYSLLGIDPSYLRLDTRSLVSLVGRGPRLDALCDLLEEEALSHEALGDAAAAAQCRRRASELQGGSEGKSD